MVNSPEQFPPEGVIVPDRNLVAQTGAHVKGILQSMGGNDSEQGDVDIILQEVMNGTRTDLVQAILDLEAIPNNKHGNGGHGLEG